MISNSNVKSKDYYTKEYMRDDYYNKQGNQVEGIGQWNGKGCERLGLKGEVNQKQFWNYLDGRNPNNHNEKLSPYVRNDEANKQPEANKAQDFVLNANKDFTILCEVYADDPEMSKKLDEIWNQANETMRDEIEQRLTTRENGKFIPVEGAISATWQHRTAREQDGKIDPHKHSHNVYGHYQPSRDGTMKAVDFGRVFNDKLLIGSKAQEVMAKGVRDLGFEIEEGKTGWKLKHLSDEVRQDFSGRGEQIKKGIGENATYEEKQKEANKKQAKGDYQLEDLKEQWKERLEKHGVTRDTLDTVRQLPKEPQKTITKEDILRKACQISKSSTFTSKHIDIALAQKGQVFDFDQKKMKEEIFKDKSLVKTNQKSKDGQALYYSKAITSKTYQNDMQKMGEANNRIKSAQVKNSLDMQKGGLEKMQKSTPPKGEKQVKEQEKSKDSKENTSSKQPQNEHKEPKSQQPEQQPQQQADSPNANSSRSGIGSANAVQSINELMGSIKSLEERLFKLKPNDPERYVLQEKLNNLQGQLSKTIEERNKEEAKRMIEETQQQKQLQKELERTR